jgi:hypothetical protein
VPQDALEKARKIYERELSASGATCAIRIPFQRTDPKRRRNPKAALQYALTDLQHQRAMHSWVPAAISFLGCCARGGPSRSAAVVLVPAQALLTNCTTQATSTLPIVTAANILRVCRALQKPAERILANNVIWSLVGLERAARWA